jgi:hypothetical protein
MSRVARWAGMTEGQAYTVIIGLVIGLLTAAFGIPPALRDQVTRVARSTLSPVATQAPKQSAAPPSDASGLPTSDALGGSSLSGGSSPLGSSTDVGTVGAETVGSAPSGPSALGAGAPTRQGWWTSLNFLRPNVPGVAFPVTYPPDVPEDGLYIGGGSSSPEAYAALTYQLPQGLSLTTLTLHVAPSSFTSTASALLVCPLQPESLNFTPVQGGDTKNAPHYDCSHSAKGTANATANTFSFDVRSLINGNQLAIAIVPSLPSDRAVFSHPGDGSLSGT